MIIMVFKSFDAADIANEMISNNMGLPTKCINAGTGKIEEGMTGASLWATPKTNNSMSGSWWIKKPDDQYITNIPDTYVKTEYYYGPGTITPEASTIPVSPGDIISTQTIDMSYTIVDTTGSF